MRLHHTAESHSQFKGQHPKIIITHGCRLPERRTKSINIITIHMHYNQRNYARASKHIIPSIRPSELLSSSKSNIQRTTIMVPGIR